MIVQSFKIIQYIWQNNPFWLFPIKLLQAFFWQIEKRVWGRVKSKKLFNGKKIFLYPNTPSASSLVYAQIPDRPAILALRNLANEKTIFLDIGANIGLYSLCLVDKVQSVYAFEAHPQTTQLLKMNFLLNGLPLDQIEQKAVTDSVGRISFSNQPDGSPINAITEEVENSIQVETINLDQFIQTHQFSSESNFILKLDVEGAEHLVLAGGQLFLKNFPVKAILFETFSSYSDTIVQLLENLNFQISPIMDNNLIAIKKEC